MSLILNEETRCPWNTISLSSLGHLDFPYSTGNAGIMDVPARRNGAWMRLFAVCRKKIYLREILVTLKDKEGMQGQRDCSLEI